MAELETGLVEAPPATTETDDIKNRIAEAQKKLDALRAAKPVGTEPTLNSSPTNGNEAPVVLAPPIENNVAPPSDVLAASPTENGAILPQVEEITTPENTNDVVAAPPVAPEPFVNNGLNEPPHIESLSTPPSVTGDNSAPEALTPSSPAPEAPETPSVPTEVKTFLDKVMEKRKGGEQENKNFYPDGPPTAQAETKGYVDPNNSFTFREKPPEAPPKVADVSSDGDENKANFSETKESTKLNLNVASEEEIVDELTKIKGIKEKTAIFIVAQLVEFRSNGVQFNTAADLRQITGVGLVKANLIAREFDLTQIESEENPDTPEQEAADSADLDKRAESWMDKLKAGVAAMRGRVASMVGKTGAVTGATLSQIADRSRKATSGLDLGLSHSVGAMGSVVDSGFANLQRMQSEAESKPGMVDAALKKIGELKLSDKRKNILRGIATAAMASVIAALPNAAPGDNAKVAEALSAHVLKVDAASIMNAPFEGGAYTPSVAAAESPTSSSNLEGIVKRAGEVLDTPAEDVESMAATSEVQRENVDRPSEPAEEMAQKEQTAAVVDALNAPMPPIEPAIAPRVEPPAPSMRAQVAPENVFKAPEEPSTEQILDASAKFGADRVAPVEAKIEPPAPLEGVMARFGTPQAEEKPEENPTEAINLFMPTLSEQFNKKVDQATVTEAIKKGGILSNEIDAFVSENNLPPDPQAENAMKNFYVFLNSGFPWTATPENTQWQEFNSIEELNEGFQPPNTGVTLKGNKEKELYEFFHDPSKVTDEKAREIVDGMRSTAINPTNMDSAQLQQLLEYLFKENK